MDFPLSGNVRLNVAQMILSKKKEAKQCAETEASWQK